MANPRILYVLVTVGLLVSVGTAAAANLGSNTIFLSGRIGKNDLDLGSPLPANCVPYKDAGPNMDGTHWIFDAWVECYDATCAPVAVEFAIAPARESYVAASMANVLCGWFNDLRAYCTDDDGGSYTCSQASPPTGVVSTGEVGPYVCHAAHAVPLAQVGKLGLGDWHATCSMGVSVVG